MWQPKTVCRIDMMRKETKQSRSANSTEKAYMAWIKNRGICAACGNDGGVIVHHCAGSSYKIKVDFETVLIGHSFVLGLCVICDNLITRGSRKYFEAQFGKQKWLWQTQYAQSPVTFPENVVNGILKSDI